MLPLSNPEDVNLKDPSPAQPDNGDVWGAGFELAMMDTPVSAWARDSALDEMQGKGALLTPEQANEKYPVEVPFNKPINEQAALFLSEEYQRKRELQQVIENGPTGAGITNFAASAVAHMMDPIEFGAGAIAGMGIARVGAIASKSTIPAISATGRAITAPLSVTGTLARESAENFVGNLAAEAYVVNKSKRAQIDYQWEDAFANSLVSGVIGGGISTATKYGLKSAFKLAGKSDTALGTALQGTKAQLEADRVPTPDVVESVWAKQAYGEPNPQAKVQGAFAEYKFAPISADQISSVKLYSPTAASKTLSNGSLKFGHEFGDGLTLTDNPHIANNVSAHAFNDGSTTVAEINLQGAKLLDLDKQLDDMPELAAVREQLGNVRTMGEYVNQLRAKIDSGKATDADFDKFNDMVKASGYDGYKTTVQEGQPFNQVHIFPESVDKVQASGFMKGDKSMAPEFPVEDISNRAKTSMDKENDLFFDREAQKEFDEFQTPEEPDFEAVKKDVEEKFATIDAMAKQELLDSETIQLVEKLKQEKQFFDKMPEVVQNFANCLLRGA